MNRKLMMVSIVAVVWLFALTLSSWATDWYVPTNFSTIQAAINSEDVVDGDKIIVAPGYREGATVTKAVEIKGEGGATINSGPLPWSSRTFMAGFLFQGNGTGTGATISHFRFETLEFPVFSRGANEVTVEHCTMVGAIQAVTNWHGSGWNISHNLIEGLQTSCGGGIGIFVGCCLGGAANDNLIAHNTVTGDIVVPIDDCGGYSGPGIALMSDRRGGSPGGGLSGNRVLKNKVSLSSTDLLLVPAVGIELTDEVDGESPVIEDLLDNKVGFNDVRNMDGVPIALIPELTVDGNNVISRNLGDDVNNRGHGVHPKALFD